MTLDPNNRFVSQQEKNERRRKYLRDSLTHEISQQLFQYQTMKARLNSKDKSLSVTILQEQQLNQNKTLNSEWFFELESLINWLNQHLEVKSVYFHFDTPFAHFPYFQFEGMTQSCVWQFYQRLRKLVSDITNLPQTTLFNARDGLTGPWLELFLAFDQRVCGPGAYFNWDHLSWGHYPAAGSLPLLHTEGIATKNKYWMLNSAKVSSHMAYTSGLIHELLYNEEDISPILQKNSFVSSTARIQLKKGLIEKRNHELQKTQLHDLACLNGALESGDWLIALEALKNDTKKEFQNPQKIKIELAEKGGL